MNHRTTILGWTLVVLALSTLATNPLLTMLAVGSFSAVLLITWRPGEAPSLAFACLLQWLASALSVFRADFEGVEVHTLSFTQHFEDAIALSLLAVVMFSFGCRCGMGWSPVLLPRQIIPDRGLEQRLLTFWIVGDLLATLFTFFDRGGLSQAVRVIQMLKWVPVSVVFLVVLNTGRGYRTLLIVFLGELGMGFLSFFASFKIPIFILAIAAVATQRRRRVSLGQVIGITFAGVLSLYLGVIWSAIKSDYREYLSNYSGAQTISVSAESQIKKLIELVTEIDSDTLKWGAENLANRITYVEYFAATIDYVPAVQPHEDGARLLGAFQHVLMPRLLFPDKPILDDTRDTERYTGYGLVNPGKQSSISIGYPAEAYVDAGPWFMFGIVFFFGFLHGLLARRFLRQTEDPLLGCGFAIVLWLTINSLENGFAKMLGCVVMMAVTFEIVWRIMVARVTPWLWRYNQSIYPPPRQP